MHRYIPLFVSLLFAISSAAHIGAQETLRWKFEKGQKLNLEFTQQFHQQAEFATQKTDTTVDLLLQMTWTVDEVAENGNAVITQTIDRVKVSMEAPTVEKVEYDSSAEAEPVGDAQIFAEKLKPLIGIKFVQTMSPRGEVLSVQVDEDTQKALDGAGGLAQMFNRENIKQLFSQVSTVFPEQPVSPGDTWEEQFTTRHPLASAVVDTTYRYEGKVQREVVGEKKMVDHISMEMDMSLAPSGVAGRQVKLKSQTGKGSLYFDSDLGRLVEAESEQKIVAETIIRDTTVRSQLDAKTNLVVK